MIQVSDVTWTAKNHNNVVWVIYIRIGGSSFN